MFSFEKFIESKWSLVLLADDRIVFRSQASDLKPLVRFLKSGDQFEDELTVYDKYVGRAAALLITLIKPRKVLTPVISDGGKEVLTKYSIPFKAKRQVKYLMGVASDQMCRWEKMATGKSPQEFWDMLK